MAWTSAEHTKGRAWLKPRRAPRRLSVCSSHTLSSPRLTWCDLNADSFDERVHWPRVCQTSVKAQRCKQHSLRISIYYDVSLNIDTDHKVDFVMWKGNQLQFIKTLWINLFCTVLLFYFTDCSLKLNHFTMHHDHVNTKIFLTSFFKDQKRLSEPYPFLKINWSRSILRHFGSGLVKLRDISFIVTFSQLK